MGIIQKFLNPPDLLFRRDALLNFDLLLSALTPRRVGGGGASRTPDTVSSALIHPANNNNIFSEDYWDNASLERAVTEGCGGRLEDASMGQRLTGPIVWGILIPCTEEPTAP